MKASTCHGLLAQVLVAEKMAIDSSVNSTQDVSMAVQTSDTLNKSWKNDKSKFGFKMLQKMGWTEGKGLGKNEDGMAEHVKVAKKSNNLGLGAKSDSTGAESWASTAISFNGVLEALGKAYGSAATRKSSQKDMSISNTRSGATSKKRRKDKKCKDNTDSANTDKSGSSSGSESVSAAQAASHCPSRAKRIQSKDVKAFSSADLRAILGQAAPANDSPSATVAGSNLIEEDARTTKSSKKKKKAKLRGKDKGGSNQGDNDADDDDASPRSMDLVETEVPTSAAKRRRIEGMELGENRRQEVGRGDQGGGARENHMSTESLSLESDRNDKEDKKKSKKRRKEAQEGKVERDDGTTRVVAGKEKKRRKKKSASGV